MHATWKALSTGKHWPVGNLAAGEDSKDNYTTSIMIEQGTTMWCVACEGICDLFCDMSRVGQVALRLRSV
ncbi:Protein of unknown function [Pyronema omphalodes CBS 100304]|uniref:Uncharacterized protein n=1 Tax=Pyronema omphalodes (strain CBS 100304) TaxID=1076935 RepID=U4LQU6_PYROM|nr:Protein of unknown function [Pyronema omphalodes CBS 100304]